MAESVLMCPKGGTNMTGEVSRRSFLKYTALTAVAVAGSSLLTGCGSYSAMQKDVGTKNTVLKVVTKLEQVDVDGDLEITGKVTGYNVTASSITADEVAASNKLTITVKVSFMNRKHPEDDFTDKSFSSYAEYDSTLSIDAVEASLTAEIVEKLVEDIFNASVAQW